MTKYQIGQKVETVYGEAATIHDIDQSGETTLYFVYIAGRGMMWSHETKLMSR